MMQKKKSSELYPMGEKLFKENATLVLNLQDMGR